MAVAGRISTILHTVSYEREMFISRIQGRMREFDSRRLRSIFVPNRDDVYKTLEKSA